MSRDAQLAYVDFDRELRTPQRVIALGATQPTWSPDGRRIAYASTHGLTVANPDGGNAHVIADGGQPAWSPDGTRIAYTAAPGVGIHVIGADGPRSSRTSSTCCTSGEHPNPSRREGRRCGSRLTHDASIFFGSDDFQPAAAPSGRTIAFTAEPQFGGTELRFVRSDGRGERRLT
jgi:Tol biopolymer transport system component